DQCGGREDGAQWRRKGRRRILGPQEKARIARLGGEQRKDRVRANLMGARAPPLAPAPPELLHARGIYFGGSQAPGQAVGRGEDRGGIPGTCRARRSAESRQSAGPIVLGGRAKAFQQKIALDWTGRKCSNSRSGHAHTRATRTKRAHRLSRKDRSHV